MHLGRYNLIIGCAWKEYLFNIKVVLGRVRLIKVLFSLQQKDALGLKLDWLLLTCTLKSFSVLPITEHKKLPNFICFQAWGSRTYKMPHLFIKATNLTGTSFQTHNHLMPNDVWTIQDVNPCWSKSLWTNQLQPNQQILIVKLLDHKKIISIFKISWW